ncbi:MAG: PAS domain-containing protein [Pseudanabaenales cyanobacterium]|nr:PAS domain-containing protein [Pseudanabaenales cyanobacterium]
MLLESQERYALAVRGSGEGLWDWNILTNALYLAPRFKQIMGYQDDQLPNDFDAWEIRLHPADRARVHGAVQNHLNQL